MSNYQAKFKHVAGTFLKEISINFIVIGQRHYGRVIVIPPRGKKVPEGEDMLAFYKPMHVIGSTSIHTHGKSHCQSS